MDNNKICVDRLDTLRTELVGRLPEKCTPSVVLYSTHFRRELRSKLLKRHAEKLRILAQEQQRPLFQVKDTVVLHNIDTPPPAYVMATLALGPKNSVLDSFKPHDVLAELDDLLAYCRKNNVSEETISDINIKTLGYIKKCKKLKSSRNIQMTKRYLKDNDLLAVPFDKGVGICLMKKEDYCSKLNDILQLPQFQKVEKGRKNEKNPLLKEEERIVEALKTLRDDGKIERTLYKKLKPRGSQPARLYGTGKVHKTTVPLRPVLSMPGSSYFKIGEQVAEWLSKVPECKINCSSKAIADKLSEIKLGEDKELISFDVVSLYTNVPVNEAIEVCANLLYNGVNEAPPVDKETFIALAKMSSCNVLMSTHDGYYQQVDGLAMGSPPAPHLANGWLSKYDPDIAEGSRMYFRYMDDVIRDIKTRRVEEKLAEINNLNPALDFTAEREQREVGERKSNITVLDLKIINDAGNLSSTWYSKPTDTGLVLNYHALAPRRYKKSVVAGFVARIHRACSTWEHFHQSLEKAKVILENNQYPPSFYNPIISDAIDKLMGLDDKEMERDNQASADEARSQPANQPPKKLLFVQYRGKCTEDYANALRKLEAPCTVVMTTRKLKTLMPSLKPPVEKMLRSNVVYKITCPCCQACYVGQTCRHMKTRLTEHKSKKKPVGRHFKCCRRKLKDCHVEILAQTTRGETYRLTLEALWIKELRPAINTRDEYKSRTLTIKW